jgi:hypothetical protein
MSESSDASLPLPLPALGRIGGDCLDMIAKRRLVLVLIEAMNEV